MGSPECACVSRTKNPHFLAPASRILSLSGASRVSLSPRLARKIESTQRLKNLKPCAQQPKPAAARLRACPSSPCWRGNSRCARRRTRLWCPVKEKKIKSESALFATRKGRCSKRQTYLRPGPVPLLHHLSDGPLAGVGALEHVINHHFRGEGCGDVEDLEVAVAEFPSSQFYWVLPLKQDVPIWETPEREGGREEKEEEENNNKNSQ